MAKWFENQNTSKVSSQNVPIPGREVEMKQNNAGGVTFTLSAFARLDQFLILGSEGGTYYASEQKATRENTQNVQMCLKEDGLRVVEAACDVSVNNRAYRNSPAIFTLALATVDGAPKVKAAVYKRLGDVCRIPTHLFMYLSMVRALGGNLGGNGFKRALARWYTTKPLGLLENQLVKYRQREGWTHRDVLRLAHIKPEEGAQNALFRWVVKEQVPQTTDASCKLLQAFLAAQTTKDVKVWCRLIRDNNLTREMLPTEALQSKDVWEHLLQKMPMTAMLRNLGKMSSLGLLTDMSAASAHVCAAVTNEEALRKARVHPMGVLLALTTYKAGKGVKGKLSWSPAREVIDALDEAFYASFGSIVPTGKRICLALDVSGSMGMANIMNTHLSCRDASAALAMVTARTERQYRVVGFTSQGGYGGRGLANFWQGPKAASGRWGGSSGLTELSISPRQRMDDVVAHISGLPFGGTDCALPMLWAKEQDGEFDAFLIFTDSETWAGGIQPTQALEQYRQAKGVDAKLVVNGMTSNGFSIADPKDPGQMDVVGFDANAPRVISDFVR